MSKYKIGDKITYNIEDDHLLYHEKITNFKHDIVKKAKFTVEITKIRTEEAKDDIKIYYEGNIIELIPDGTYRKCFLESIKRHRGRWSI